MAEYCFDCYNQVLGIKCDKSEVELSLDLDLCEGCGEMKQVVICMRRHFFYNEAFLVFYVIAEESRTHKAWAGKNAL